MYMDKRQNISPDGSFHTMYMNLLDLISIGKEMLPESENNLRKIAGQILMDKRIYPDKITMNIDDSHYRLGGGESTGIINVRPEDIEYGIHEVRDQQSVPLIKEIKEIDSKILRALIKSGIVIVKRPDIRTELSANIIKNFKKKIKEKE